MAKYARDTSVSTEKSKANIERVLRKYGATGFFSAWEEDVAHVGFRIDERVIKMRVLLPPLSDFQLTETGRDRKPEAAYTGKKMPKLLPGSK